MGYKLDDIRELNFAAGTMFFARVDALKPLLSLGLTDDDFDIESGQVDGTIAHAIERIISVSCQCVSPGLRLAPQKKYFLLKADSQYSFTKVG